MADLGYTVVRTSLDLGDEDCIGATCRAMPVAVMMLGRVEETGEDGAGVTSLDTTLILPPSRASQNPGVGDSASTS